MIILRASFLAILLLLALPVAAVIETYEFSDPHLAERYHALSAELRCPKCQNQNIADSDAPISKDLRRTLHEKLEEGATDNEILDYMVARYGEFVRYRPSFEGANLVLWLAPILLLGCGACVLLLTLRRKRGDALASEAKLDESDRDKVAQILQERDA